MDFKISMLRVKMKRKEVGYVKNNFSYCPFGTEKNQWKKMYSEDLHFSATENTYETILEFIYILRCADSKMAPNDLCFLPLKFIGSPLSRNVGWTYWLTSKENNITEETVHMPILKLVYKNTGIYYGYPFLFFLSDHLT